MIEEDIVYESGITLEQLIRISKELPDANKFLSTEKYIHRYTIGNQAPSKTSCIEIVFTCSEYKIGKKRFKKWICNSQVII